MSEELTEDELLAQALASMDSTPPGGRTTGAGRGAGVRGRTIGTGLSGRAGTATSGRVTVRSLEEPQSLVLQELDASRRPKARTVCERCPNSVWFSSPTEVKCYCRVMFLVSWSTKEPNQITGCDGMFLGQDDVC
jgi:hypothetical protein